jgi:hypothetical protein
MIPVTQTKVVVKNSKGERVVSGNCYASAIASIMELPLSEVPNVEVFFHMQDEFWQTVMLTFINSKGWDLCSDDRFKVFHDDQFGVNESMREVYIDACKDKYYLVTGKSERGVHHICIYRNGALVHDPHPSRDGLLTIESFKTLEKINPTV